MKALFIFLLVLAMAAAVGKITAAFVVKSLAAETRQEQIAVRTPTLQELIHDLVMEGRKDLPRKKIETPEGAIWLASIDERQNQIVLTYEFVGVSPEVFDENTHKEWRQEGVEAFRVRCRIPAFSSLLRQGMTVAHVYRVRQTGKTLTIFVFSQRDC